MSARFNLIDEPWLPCLMLDGALKELSLRDALGCAAEVQELRDYSPLVTAALHRLLLALLHSVLDGPRNQAAWHCLWIRGSFDADMLSAYLNRPCGAGAVHERFDLFHPSDPFYQTTAIPQEIKPSGIVRLAPELANGGESSAHFNHDADDEDLAVSPQVAARWLIGQQATAFGGTIGAGRGNYYDAPMTRGILFLVRGDNLFQTLMLNLIEYDERRPIPRADDKPGWERGAQPVNQKRAPAGYLDYLTWQSRAIRLEVPATVQSGVRRCTFYDGQGLIPPRPDIDPMMAYRRDDSNRKQPISPLRLRADRALWRDADALFAIDPVTTEAAWRKPRSMEMLASLASRQMIPQSLGLRVMACGWASNQAKVDLWRHETLPLPLKYLDDAELVGDLKKSLTIANAVAEALHDAVRCAARIALSPANPLKADQGRVKQLFDSLAPERLYWPGLEDQFRRLLVNLPGDAAHRLSAIQGWFNETLRRAAHYAYDRTAGELESSARALRAAVEGKSLLNRELACITQKYQFSDATQEMEKVHVDTSN